MSNKPTDPSPLPSPEERARRLDTRECPHDESAGALWMCLPCVAHEIDEAVRAERERVEKIVKREQINHRWATGRGRPPSRGWQACENILAALRVPSSPAPAPERPRLEGHCEGCGQWATPDPELGNGHDNGKLQACGPMTEWRLGVPCDMCTCGLSALLVAAPSSPAERGPCIVPGCSDTAKKRYAVCYTHRNKPYWDLAPSSPAPAPDRKEETR